MHRVSVGPGLLSASACVPSFQASPHPKEFLSPCHPPAHCSPAGHDSPACHCLPVLCSSRRCTAPRQPRPPAARSTRHGGPTPAPGSQALGTLDERTLDLTVQSRAMRSSVPVRVILPKNWHSERGRTFPVVYMLHGGADDYTCWTRETDVEVLADLSGVMVIMPTARYGYYSDWYAGGRRLGDVPHPRTGPAHGEQIPCQFLPGRHRPVHGRVRRAQLCRASPGNVPVRGLP